MDTNCRKQENTYIEWEPIIGGKKVYTWSGNQSQEGREYTTGVGTNDRREVSIHLEWEPIIGGKRVYTRSGNQSREESEYTT